MANNFADILNRSADDVRPPPVLPQGPYLTIVQGLPEQFLSSRQKTPGLRFTLKIISALEGVDEEAVAGIEGGVVGKTIKNELYLTDNSLFMLKNFFEHCGIDVAGKSMGELIDETPNREVVAYIKHDMIGEGDEARPIAKVGRTAPAEG